MHSDYSDILARAGEPTYYGAYGVPRYAEFTPITLNVFAKYAAKLRILCQACGREFCAVSVYEKTVAQVELPDREGPLDPWDAIGSFHYGNPPVHGCAGDGMASMPLEIVEFWWRTNLTDWTRDADFEFVLKTPTRAVEAG